MKEKILVEIGSAVEEVKRVEHQIYVSLKYTRTVDVILNCLNRIAEGYKHLVNALLLIAEKQGRTEEQGIDIASVEGVIARAEMVAKLFKDDTNIVDNMELYILIRKILLAKNIQRSQEYRRHVRLTTIIDSHEEIVDIDIITNYYFFQKDFLKKVSNLAKEVLDMEKKEE